MVDNGKNKNAAAKQFGVDRKRIRDWEMNEQLLREQTDVHRKRQRFTGGPGRRLISVDLDKALIEWYKEQIAQQRHVFNRHIKTKAIPIQSYVAPAPNHIHVYAGILPAWRMRICEPYAGKG